MNRILAPLAIAYRLGLEARSAAYRGGWLKIRRLDRPVVSVGNLSVGGTGKTPLVACVAEILLKRGWKPAILTRGYGRRRGPGLMALELGPGRNANPQVAGDEPALLARKLPEVPIVVCADRYRAGRVAEERFNVGVHVLDDGFQHWALARDVDIVGLDTTQQLSQLLPAGRLREPLSALGRAHFVMLTRTELGDPTPLDERVRRINPGIRVFRSRTRLCGLIDFGSGRELSLDDFLGKPVFAFCGIGNPGAFSADLQTWGFLLVGETAFRDHHSYSRAQLARLATGARQAGAVALLTTEKDAMNLPDRLSLCLPVIACLIRLEIAEQEVFERALVGRLEEARVGQPVR